MSEKTNPEVNEDVADGAKAFADTLDAVESLTKKVDDLSDQVKKAAEAPYPYGAPMGEGPAIRKGESALSSRPFSLARLYAALASSNGATDNSWRDGAKLEFELSKRLRDAYSQHGYSGNGILVPLATDLMPVEDLVDEESGRTLPGIPAELVKECREVCRDSVRGTDLDELRHLRKVFGIRKDLQADVATSGGLLVGPASQGELIELLRATELMSRVGAREVPLPPSGKMSLPRTTSGVTVSAYAEGATLTESTPGTGALELNAKAYSGFVELTHEFMKFAQAQSAEAFVRELLIDDVALQVDADMIAGAGGTAIQGIIDYSGVNTRTASTTAANGDTLGANDPLKLLGDIADANAPVSRGVFFSLTNTLWTTLVTQQATTNEFIHNVAVNHVGGGTVQNSIAGHPVYPTTNVPTDRSKGTASNLTILLCGVGSEWLIGRAGVLEIDVTNSHASQFSARVWSMRGTQFIDAGPRHEASFGFIDDVLNT